MGVPSGQTYIQALEEIIVLLGGTPGAVAAGGSLKAQGLVAAGAAISGENPLGIAGSDGTNKQWLRVDSSGRHIVVGAAAAGAAIAGNPLAMGVYDGTNAQYARGDSSGRQIVIGGAADGAAVAGNPVLVAGTDGTNAKTLKLDASQNLQARLFAGSTAINALASNTDATAPSGTQNLLSVFAMPVGLGATNLERFRTVGGAVGASGTGVLAAGNVLYDNPADGSGNWQLQRGNHAGTVLASAARTAQTDSATFTNHNARGVLLTLNVTVASGTGGLQVQLESIDPLTGLFFPMNTAPTAVTATGQKAYLIYPGASSGGVTQATSGILPKTWFVRVLVGDASSYTYSISYHVIV